jgi:hypothetical protein
MGVNRVRNAFAERVLRKQPFADLRVRFDDGILRIGQTLRFEQDRIGNSDFAEIMQESAHRDVRRIAIRKTNLSCQQTRVTGDSPQMTAGVRVAGLYHPRKGEQTIKKRSIGTMCRFRLAEET